MRQYYSITSPQNAYRSIGNFLTSNGFTKQRDSDYISYNHTKVQAFRLIEQFAEDKKWFAPCLKKISITPIDEVWDLSKTIKMIYADPDWEAQKRAENNRPSIRDRMNRIAQDTQDKPAQKNRFRSNSIDR